MKLLKFTMILICLLFNACTLFLSASKVSAEQDMKDTIDNYVEAFLKEHRIPGASIAIVHGNDLYYSKAWGVTGESEERVTAATPFTIGSISKSLTGLAIMKLIEEGTVHLEDPVQKYIPWFALKDKEATSKITIKHLLTHSSGISTYSGLSISDKESKGFNAIKDNVKSLSNVTLTALPGEKYQYSNANFLILGALIEEVANQTYSDYMKQEVFLPLGMKNAAADYDTAYKKGYLGGYQSWFGIPRKSSVTYDNGGAPYGYITASAEDMIQYIKFLSRQENDNFLTENTRNLYVSPHLQTGENRFYGLGIRITNPDSEEKMIWHSGSTPDSHAEMFFIPKTGWGGVILTNKNHILEEEALSYLKQGIINIINGNEPVDIPSNTPIVQLITLGIICLLFIMLIYLLVKMRSKKIRKRSIWCISGIIFLVLSIATIPVLIYSTDSPWHAIFVFSPDLAYLSIGVVILFALNGLFSIIIAYKQNLQVKYFNS
ncbi:serine hydrolase domain-containing protein [Bacillus pseudomycoides]|uniref:serine hydrolase domain-containing protein n=1 Tax=Bacillus pseudomycoides TaxID=64104 RepID=UPI000BED7D0B|nr:serine hydrolase domain-containing protein [Bacillus pseudomycoides]PED05529.1 penicillin-binding protein [Bacillus pseudomycoides]PEI96913.1 penicillin-binding protein [Bacillus pseudomycoides]PEK23530.1 penicillin-binding protein [Bacillus pseudomycoides]PEM64358.1 penicillin-binding protein [Bacillus pseudomycoides]PEO22783.1 penicillin-binding protein [Bacillus pseudomycoides]